MCQLHLSKACWELWLSDDQPHSDCNGQWQRALCILAVLQSSQQNPQRNEKNRKMYAIKQIKICAKYRDMLPRPRLDLSGTPGLRPIGLSPGSWQISLGLGSMSWYSAQILICIIYINHSRMNYFRHRFWITMGFDGAMKHKNTQTLVHTNSRICVIAMVCERDNCLILAALSWL